MERLWNMISALETFLVGARVNQKSSPSMESIRVPKGIPSPCTNMFTSRFVSASVMVYLG